MERGHLQEGKGPVYETMEEKGQYTRQWKRRASIRDNGREAPVHETRRRGGNVQDNGGEAPVHGTMVEKRQSTRQEEETPMFETMEKGQFTRQEEEQV
jgi:hypothetical protein